MTTEYPDFAIELARHRTRGMVQLYGRCVFGNEIFANMDIGTLARSCYLQGVTDAMNVMLQSGSKEEKV